MSLRTQLSVFGLVGAALVWSCGGKAVVDPPIHGQAGSGGQGATTTTTGSTGLGGEGAGTGCEALMQDLTNAISAAQACDPASPVYECTGMAVVKDTCACDLVANQTVPTLVQAANDAYDAWVAAGCGPIPCYACPPPPSSPWYCDPNSLSCQPAYEG
jgi:hypothetical protein